MNTSTICFPRLFVCLGEGLACATNVATLLLVGLGRLLGLLLRSCLQLADVAVVALDPHHQVDTVDAGHRHAETLVVGAEFVDVHHLHGLLGVRVGVGRGVIGPQGRLEALVEGLELGEVLVVLAVQLDEILLHLLDFSEAVEMQRGDDAAPVAGVAAGAADQVGTWIIHALFLAAELAVGAGGVVAAERNSVGGVGGGVSCVAGGGGGGVVDDGAFFLGLDVVGGRLWNGGLLVLLFRGFLLLGLVLGLVGFGLALRDGRSGRLGGLVAADEGGEDGDGHDGLDVSTHGRMSFVRELYL